MYVLYLKALVCVKLTIFDLLYFALPGPASTSHSKFDIMWSVTYLRVPLAVKKYDKERCSYFLNFWTVCTKVKPSVYFKKMDHPGKTLILRPGPHSPCQEINWLYLAPRTHISHNTFLFFLCVDMPLTTIYGLSASDL